MGLFKWLFGSNKNADTANRGKTQSPSSKSGAGYGMSSNNPVMTGMGPRGAGRYFRHLRCPAGQPVANSQRCGSNVVEDLSYINRNGGKPDPMFGSMRISKDSINIDVYEIECGCGRHKLQVHVDMYHIAADRCIGESGWKFT